MAATSALIWSVCLLVLLLVIRSEECHAAVGGGVSRRMKAEMEAGALSGNLEESMRTMSVHGYGEVTMEPDICYISFRSTSKDTSASVAYRMHQKQIKAIFAALKESSLGVSERDMQTRGLSLQPVYRYVNKNNEQRQVFDYYRVEQELYVSVRKVDNVSGVLDAAVAAGAEVNSVNFTVEKPHEHEEEAASLAYSNAKGKAARIAAATGVSLGKPIRITDSHHASPMQPRNYAMKARGGAMMAMATDGAVEGGTVSAGEVKLTHNVDVVYEVY